MAIHKSMSDLYRRLSMVGFDAKFVRAAILPDWWEDECAAVPFNRSLAEVAVAKQLGVSTACLRNPDGQLEFAPLPQLRLKTATFGTSAAQVVPSLRVAQRCARLLVAACPSLPQPRHDFSADSVREWILASGREAITLDSLLEFCWGNGILVAHLGQLPAKTGFRKFDGIVLFDEARPCILLCEKVDSPPRLAFHLAHELGHLMLGHVIPGGPLLADDNLERIVNDGEERAADEFALELLTGKKDPQLRRVEGLRAPQLASAAVSLGKRDRVDPGLIALIYGRCADRWPVAQSALKHLNLATGARDTIGRWIQQHLRPEELAESDLRFLEAVTLPSIAVH